MGMKIYTLQWKMRSVTVQISVNNLLAMRTMSDHGDVQLGWYGSEVASDLLERYVGLEYIAQRECQCCCNVVSE